MSKSKRICEEWRVIPSFPDYEVSDSGLVRRLTKARGTWPGKLLSRQLSDDGYYKVDLAKDRKKHGLYVHAVVCDAFIGPRPIGYQINHKDGIKTNLSPDNLEYCTISENVKHSFALGLKKIHDQSGERNHQWKGGLSDFICHKCGSSFKRKRVSVLARGKKKSNVHVFCSQQCSWDYMRGKTMAERVPNG